MLASYRAERSFSRYYPNRAPFYAGGVAACPPDGYALSCECFHKKRGQGGPRGGEALSGEPERPGRVVSEESGLPPPGIATVARRAQREGTGGSVRAWPAEPPFSEGYRLCRTPARG